MLRAQATLIPLGIRQASKMARQLQEMLEHDAAAKAKVIKEQEIKICGMAQQVEQFEKLVADLEAEKREAFMLLEEDLEREKLRELGQRAGRDDLWEYCTRERRSVLECLQDADAE